MNVKLLALVAVLAFQSTAFAELKIVATLTEIGALVEEVGGDRVSVNTLARGDEDPHAIAAKPSHSRRMSHADLLVYNGLELEVGWLPLLLDGARNPRIFDNSPGHLNLAEFIEPLDVPDHVDRNQGDVHPDGNPHYTVDPGLYPILARAISTRLTLLDPEGSNYYAARLANFLSLWQEHMEDWYRRLECMDGIQVVAYHSQWAYSARRFGFQIVDHVENQPGIPPSPRHIRELQHLVEDEKIPLLIYSDLIHPETPRRFADRAGCKAIMLPQAVGSREGVDDLFSWFELWVSLLEKAMKEG
jgi:zinc/manganese transport system substrate-binding protein